MLQNEEEYDTATARIYALMQTDLAPDSEEFHELLLLALIVEEYENKHYPVPPPDPIAVIRIA